mgnify:CR=1 FL=1
MTTITTTHETVVASIRGHRADVRFNRPDSLNAMSNLMMSDVVEVFGRLADRGDVWCATLSGEGRAFCVGADQKERRGMTHADIRRRRQLAPQAFSAMRQFPHPVIAQVHGHALGGGFEMVLGCDFAIAAADATLGLVETSRGTIPGGGGHRALIQLVGPATARELIYTARRFSGTEGQLLGIITEAPDAGQLESVVDGYVDRVLANSPVAVAQSKKVLRLSENASYEESLRIEAEHYERVLASSDRLEALQSFREKRAPQFTGE